MKKILKIKLFIILILSTIKQILAQVCPINCQACDITLICSQCQEGFNYQSSNNTCNPICDFGQYYSPVTKNCVSICPYSYYNQDTTNICSKFSECPQLKEQGQQYFNTFSYSSYLNGVLYTTGQNEVNNDYSIKIFEMEQCELLGSMQGHQYEPLQIRYSSNQQASSKKGEIEFTGSLFSLSTNEIIEWDMNYGRLKHKIQFEGGFYTSSTNKLLVYMDDQIVILNRNETQFGVFQYKQWQQNQSKFMNLIQIYPAIHKTAIRGYLKVNEDIIYSYSLSSLVKYISPQEVHRLCNFEIDVNQIYIITEDLLLITFQNTDIIQTAFRNKCTDLPTQNNDSPRKVIVIEKSQNIIIIQLTKAIIIIKISENDSQSSEMYSQELSRINSSEFILYMDIYEEKQQNSTIKKNLVFVNQLGVLFIYEIAKYSDEIEYTPDQWLQKTFELNLKFSSKVTINNLIINKDQNNIVVIGKELALIKVNFSTGSIVDKIVRRNILSKVPGHKDKINGIVQDPDNDRVITYSADGSFMIWSESVDPFSGMPKIRFILQQYHPKCDINIYSTCFYPLTILEQPRTEFLIAQYKGDNKIYVWNYKYDSVYLNNTFSLPSQNLALKNYHYNKKKNLLLLCNEKEIVVFNITTSQPHFQMSLPINQFYPFVFAAYDWSSVQGSYLNLVMQFNSSSVIYRSMRMTNLGSIAQYYVNLVVDSINYSEDSMILSIVSQTSFYIVDGTTALFKNYTKPIQQPSAVAFEPKSKNIIVFQKNLQYQGMNFTTAQTTGYIASKFINFASLVDQNGVGTTSTPQMYFFYQNTPISFIQNQVIASGLDLDVQLVVSFEERLSGLSANQKSQKMYVGFENGDVQSSYFQQNYLLSSFSSTSAVNFIYNKNQNKIYFYAMDIYITDLINIQTNKLVTPYTATTLGLILDEINQNIIIFAHTTVGNFCIYNMTSLKKLAQLTEGNPNGTTLAFLDVERDFLISYYSGTNDFFVWKYSNRQFKQKFAEHTNIVNNEKSQMDDPSQLIYNVTYIYYNKVEEMVISINNLGGILRYYYANNTFNYTVIPDFKIVYYDEDNRLLYLNIPSQISYSTLLIVDTLTLSTVYFNNNQYLYQIAGIIFQGPKVYIYDDNKLNVCDRKTFKILSTIISINPKFQSIIISEKLDLLVVWNNFVISKNTIIGLYGLSDGRSIYEISSYQQIEAGLINQVAIDEDSQQLFFTKDSKNFLFAFDLKKFRYSAYYLLGFDTMTIKMEFIPEFNTLVLLDSSKIWYFKVENAINVRDNFRSLYSSLNTDYIVNPTTQKVIQIDRDNVVWEFDYNTQQLRYLQQFSQVRETYIVDNQFYVILNNTLLQYDNNFQKLNSIDGRFTKIWFSQDFIFLETVLQQLIAISKNTFQLKTNFSFQHTSNIQQLLIIEDYKELMIIFATFQVFHYNFETATLINKYTNQDTIKKLYYDPKNKAIFALFPLSLVVYPNFTKGKANFADKANCAFFNSTSTVASIKDIRNFYVDADYNRIFVVYTQMPFISIHNYTYITNTTVSKIDQISAWTTPSRTPNVMFQFTKDTIQIQNPWQIVQYSRKNLSMINIYRDNRYLYGMTYYIISPEFPQFRFITEQDAIILLLRESSNDYSIIYKFSLSYPTITNYGISVQGDQYYFKINGISNGVFFNYEFFLPLSISVKKQSTFMNQCYQDAGNVKYDYNQYNKLSDLQNSFSKLGLSIQRSLVYVQPTLQFFVTKHTNQIFSKMVFTSKENIQQLLNLEQNSFSNLQIEHLIIQNFDLSIKNVQKVEFNKFTRRITLQNVKLIDNGLSFSLNFKDIDYLVIEQMTIQNNNFTNSNIIVIDNCSHVWIKNLTFKNITILQESSLFQIANSQNVKMDTLAFEDIRIKSFSSVDELVLFQNLNKLTLINLSANKIVNQLLQNFFFIKSQGNSIVKLTQIDIANLNNVSFLQWLNNYVNQLKIFYTSFDNLVFTNVTIENVKQLTYPLIYFEGNHFEINSSAFKFIECPSCLGAVISTKKIIKFNIIGTEFSSNVATSGGAISIKDSQYNLLVFERNTFKNNTASSSGGAIYLVSSDLELFDNTFSDNKAQVGGAIRYINIEPLFVYRMDNDQTFKNNNTFVNNYASIHSQNYGSYTHTISIVSKPQQEQQKQGRMLSQEVEEKNDLSDYIIQTHEITDFQSGGNVNFEFKIQDREGNPVKFNLTQALNGLYQEEILSEIKSFVIKGFVQEEGIKIYGQYITDYLQFKEEKSIFAINEMNVVSIPQSTYNIYFEVPSIKRVPKNDIRNRNFIDGPFYIKVSVNFRKCIVGEIYKETSGLYLCQECKEGFYSLEEPIISNSTVNQQTCKRCPAEASHCYRNQITLQEGYWKYDNSSDRIISCQNKPSNCNSDQSKNYCKEGHFGPLCEYCDNNGEIWGSKYMSDGKYNCISCKALQNDFKFILPSIVVGILMICYMIFSIRIAIEISEYIVIGYYLRNLGMISISKSAYQDTTNMNMKAMMNYMQIAQLVNTFQVELPEFLKILPEYLGSPINNFMYTFDCYLSTLSSQRIPLIFLRTIWSLLMPFMYIFGIGLVYFILVQTKILMHNRSHLISGLVFLIFFLQPNMVSNLLSVMSCRVIDDKKYILADTSQVCYTTVHIKYIFFICVPALSLWALILPFFIIRKLYLFRKNLDNALIRIPYGFLYQDYKTNYFYWEFFKSYIKITIITIINFYGDPYNNKLVITMIIFLLYLVFLEKAKPYQMNYFQNLEKRSMVVLIVIILMNIFLYNRPDIVQQQIFYIIVLGIHNCYQLYLIYEVARAKLSIIFKVKLNIIKLKLIEWFPRLQKYITITKKNNMRAFFIWKRVRKEIIEMSLRRQNLIKSKNVMDEMLDHYAKQQQMTPQQIALPLSFNENSSRNCVSNQELEMFSQICKNNLQEIKKSNIFLIKIANQNQYLNVSKDFLPLPSPLHSPTSSTFLKSYRSQMNQKPEEQNNKQEQTPHTIEEENNKCQNNVGNLQCISPSPRDAEDNYLQKRKRTFDHKQLYGQKNQFIYKALKKCYDSSQSVNIKIVNSDSFQKKSKENQGTLHESCTLSPNNKEDGDSQYTNILSHVQVNQVFMSQRKDFINSDEIVKLDEINEIDSPTQALQFHKYLSNGQPNNKSEDDDQRELISNVLLIPKENSNNEAQQDNVTSNIESISAENQSEMTKSSQERVKNDIYISQGNENMQNIQVQSKSPSNKLSGIEQQTPKRQSISIGFNKKGTTLGDEYKLATSQSIQQEINNNQEYFFDNNRLSISRNKTPKNFEDTIKEHQSVNSDWFDQV